MISFSQKIYDQMIEHAKKDYPNEACGLLGGPPTKEDVSADALVADKRRIASVFYPMRNLDNASISYFMDSREQLQVMKKMREANIELCGIFHSHVASEAYPSEKDVRLAFYGDRSTEIFPAASYLIVSLSDMKDPVLRSFKIAQEKVTEEKISII
jgi:proteasome lid subunit RPN8/RPN11